MLRVAVYERVINKQGLNNGNLQNLSQYCNDIIEKSTNQDWQLYKYYVDRDALEIHPRKRDVFLDLMIDAELGCFDLIITRDRLSFSRCFEKALEEVENFRGIGVDVYFIEDHI